MTKSTDTHLIGWDIGGAHLKAARVDNGRVTGVVQIACPLWQGLDRLDAALAQARSALGASNRHAVTMTGEMVDLFDSRTGGVIGITQHLEANLPGAITLFAGRAGWLTPAQAADHADDIASANWLATAEWIATRCPQALLADIGSTTSDLIVIDHGVAGTSRSDADRLISGELVYAGVVRTPLMALAQKIRFKGRTLPRDGRTLRHHSRRLAPARSAAGRRRPLPDRRRRHEDARGQRAPHRPHDRSRHGGRIDRRLARTGRCICRRTDRHAGRRRRHAARHRIAAPPMHRWSAPAPVISLPSSWRGNWAAPRCRCSNCSPTTAPMTAPATQAPAPRRLRWRCWQQVER
jgi:hypothetical protein